MEATALTKFRYEMPENCNDDFQIEYEILPAFDKKYLDPRRVEIAEKIADIDYRIAELDARVDKLNIDIEKLTNHADGLDYTIAVASGVVCGLIDSFFIGEFSLTKANEWGTEKVNSFVKFVAKQQSGKEKDLFDSIQYLENQWKIPSDNKANILGGPTRHHLHDFSHHPTAVGLFFSMLTQFTGNAYGVNSFGQFIAVPVDSTFIGKDFPTKISLGLITWFFHLVSDVAGSSRTIELKKTGTGLPGPIISLLYEVSMIPCFKSKDGTNKFSLWIARLWNGALKDPKGNLIMPVRFDLRTELGLIHELGKQAIPVIINECFVRGFYFIRRFVSAIKETPIHSLSDFFALNWNTILPFKNRTIVRMITISAGTFTAIDLADASIRAAIKNGPPTNPLFWKDFILRVNFVGVGRFVIAVGTDVGMGIKRQRLIKERMQYMCEIGMFQIAKVFYLQENMWIEAQNTEKAFTEMIKVAENSIIFFADTLEETLDICEKLGKSVSEAEKNNPGLKKRIIKYAKKRGIIK